MKSSKRYLALAAVTVVAIAAAVPAIAATGSSSRATTMPSAPRAAMNIVQTAAAAGEFKTLIKLAKRAGLARTLESTGPLTVFAPTDAALAKLPRAAVSSLVHNRSALRAVLLYHVLKGRYTAARLLRLHRVQALNGEWLTVRVRNGVVKIGGVRVIKANVSASNGVIHVIAGVLIPR